MTAAVLAMAMGLAGAGGPPAMVYLGDGSSVPLSSWSLSYEYVSWRQGTDPGYGEVARRQERELLLGRKRLDLAGSTLEVQADADPRRRLALVRAGGRREPLKVEAPAREALAPEAGKDLLVMARSLDLVGESLTGTRREFCLASFTILVKCGGSPGQRVVRVEFPGKE